jgi:hypothetical protein
MADGVNRRAVLSLWQERWEQLSDRHGATFLERPEVDELTTMADETVRMAVRAHKRLAEEILHARWVAAGRLGTAGCGCAAEEAEMDAWAHKLTVIPGPDTRTGSSRQRSSTVVGRCSCGREVRGGSEDAVRSYWVWHVRGDDEAPLDDW